MYTYMSYCKYDFTRIIIDYKISVLEHLSVLCVTLCVQSIYCRRQMSLKSQTLLTTLPPPTSIAT